MKLYSSTSDLVPQCYCFHAHTPLPRTVGVKHFWKACTESPPRSWLPGDMITGLVSANSFTTWITNTYIPQTTINFTSVISCRSSSAPVFHMIDQSHYRFMWIIFITNFWWTPIRIKHRPVICSVQLLHLCRWKESSIKVEQQNLKPSLSSGELEYHLALGFLSVKGDCELNCLVKLPVSVLVLSFLDKHLDSLNSNFHHLI